MAVTIEDILLQRSLQDRENRVDPVTAAALGAASGTTVGAMANRKKRFAGGLTGLILGGGLGAGVRQQMITESPAARYLAKIQVGEDLTSQELNELEDILTNTYSNIIG